MKYMKMTIDDADTILSCERLDSSMGCGASDEDIDKALGVAIEVIQKYKNLQNKLDQLEHEMEITLESDTRTMINRESDDGWLFDKIIRWRKIISEV